MKMVGRNEMILNEATLAIAIQEWLERYTVQKAPKVIGIKEGPNTGAVRTFLVQLDSNLRSVAEQGSR